MHQSLQIVTASTCEPLTRDEAKKWLKISDDLAQDEPLIDLLLTAARRKVEERTQRFFYRTSCALHLDAAPEESTGVIKVPAMPLASVTSMTSYDSTDGATAMSTDAYTVDTVSEPGRIALRGGYSWPTNLRPVNGLVVALTAGYSTSTSGGMASVPADAMPMLSAVQLLLAHLYENRQQVVVGERAALADLPYGVEYLLSGLVSPEVEG